VAILAVPSLARAQAPSAAELTEAERQFSLGVSAYQAEHLDDALVLFMRAYELSQAPELLYNVATVHERLRHDADALDAYESYLEAVPTSSDRATIEARIRLLREAVVVDVVREMEAPAPTPAPAALAIDSAPSGSDPAPWILTTAGLVVAAGGGVLVALAALDTNTITSTTSWTEASAARDRAPIFSGLGLAAIGAGAITAVIGIVWGVTSPSASSVHVGVGLGSLSLSGTF